MSSLAGGFLPGARKREKATLGRFELSDGPIDKERTKSKHESREGASPEVPVSASHESRFELCGGMLGKGV